MNIDKFENKLNEVCGCTAKEQMEYLKRFNKNILDKNDYDIPWKLFHQNFRNNIESGAYLVLKCGLNGIYQTINIWDADNMKWTIESADASYVIMYKDIEPYLNK